MLSKLAMDKTSRVIVYRAGTQSQVAVSDPAPEHRITLEPGDYDVYRRESFRARGVPTRCSMAVHLDPGAKVSREVPLD